MRRGSGRLGSANQFVCAQGGGRLVLPGDVRARGGGGLAGSGGYASRCGHGLTSGLRFGVLGRAVDSIRAGAS